MNRTTILAGAALGVIAVVAIAVMNLTGGEDSATARAELETVARTLRAQKVVVFTTNRTHDDPPHYRTYAGSTRIDFANQRMVVDRTVTEAGRSTRSMHVIAGPTGYLWGSADGDRWQSYPTAGSIMSIAPTLTDGPSAWLDRLLRNATAIRDGGTAKVDGVVAHKYVVTSDPNKQLTPQQRKQMEQLRALTGPITYDYTDEIWVNDADLPVKHVRREATTMKGATSTNTDVDVYTQFGGSVVIATPDPSITTPLAQSNADAAILMA